MYRRARIFEFMLKEVGAMNSVTERESERSAGATTELVAVAETVTSALGRDSEGGH